MRILHMKKHNVEYWIQKCEGKHLQQIAFSSYHFALTQICFTCQKIRTSLLKEEIKVDDDRGILK